MTVGDALRPDFGRMLDECVGLLQEYVRIDTTNPPGDVTEAADWLESLLGREGVRVTRLAERPDKPNLVATIGQGHEARPLVLAHHMDIVPAVSSDWSAEPFGGEVRDGFVWGRGALDMKGFGVMTLVVALAIMSAGLPLRRPIRLLATSDEEVGGVAGAKWLAAEHFDDVAGEYLLTEGSFGRAGPRATYYAVQVAEKGVSTMRLIARGQPGHASSPRADNAIVRMARAIARIGLYRSPPGALHLARRYLSAFPPAALHLEDGRSVASLDDTDIEELLHQLSGGSRIQNMLRNTFSPTMVNAGLGQNVIPPSCEAYVDCRTLPGVSASDLVAELAAVIDDPAIELELVKTSQGTESPAASELYDAITKSVGEARPGAAVVPFLTAGGTDCKHFRPKGVVAYGNIPFELDDGELDRIHGVDERVSLENLRRGLEILFGTVARLCVPASYLSS